MTSINSTNATAANNTQNASTTTDTVADKLSRYLKNVQADQYISPEAQQSLLAGVRNLELGKEELVNGLTTGRNKMSVGAEALSGLLTHGWAQASTLVAKRVEDRYKAAAEVASLLEKKPWEKIPEYAEKYLDPKLWEAAGKDKVALPSFVRSLDKLPESFGADHVALPYASGGIAVGPGATASQRNVIILLQPGSDRGTVLQHTAAIKLWTAAVDSPYVVAYQEDGYLVVWDAADGRKIKQIRSQEVEGMSLRRKLLLLGTRGFTGETTTSCLRVWNDAVDLLKPIFSGACKFITADAMVSITGRNAKVQGFYVAHSEGVHLQATADILSVAHRPAQKDYVGLLSDNSIAFWDGNGGMPTSYDPLPDLDIPVPAEARKLLSVDGAVFICARGKSLAFSCEDGSEHHVSLDSPVKDVFGVADKYVVCSTERGTLHVFEAADGKELPRLEIDGDVQSVARGEDDSVVVCTRASGEVYTLQLRRNDA